MPRIPSRRTFSVHVPRVSGAPLVFDSPHSGFEFPPDFEPAASRTELQATWDAYVDELCNGVTEAGATLVAARFPRAYIDANRALSDIDPRILDTPWPGTVELSDHGRRGMGLIRWFARPRIPIYDRRLTIGEVGNRINRFYLPYRRALQAALNAVWRRHGVVWHFNCHSMKSRGPAANCAPGCRRPDFVIGDRNGTTAPSMVTSWVANYFRDHGYQVKINDPFCGADIVRSHGFPGQRRYSLQIEINRSLYMHERTCMRTSRFAKIQEELTAFARAVAQVALAESRRKVSR